MTRSEVIEICCYCRTLEDIATARRARGAWLKLHPDDWEVLEIGSSLCMLEDAIKITEAESGVVSAPPLEKVLAKAS